MAVSLHPLGEVALALSEKQAKKFNFSCVTLFVLCFLFFHFERARWCVDIFFLIMPFGLTNVSDRILDVEYKLIRRAIFG